MAPSFPRWRCRRSSAPSGKGARRRRARARRFAISSLTDMRSCSPSAKSRPACGRRSSSTTRSTVASSERHGTNCLPRIRGMHAGDRISWARGRAKVERGRGVLARLAHFIIGFPEAADDAQVSVKFEARHGSESWTRSFDEKSFSSRQFAGRGRSSRLLCESFGPLTFAMALVVDEGRLRLVLRRWSAFGISSPLALPSLQRVRDRRERKISLPCGDRHIRSPA